MITACAPERPRTLSEQRREVGFRISEVQDPLVVVDSEQIITDANGPFMLLTGLQTSDIGKKSLNDLVPEALRQAHVANVESQFRTPVVRTMDDPRRKVRLLTMLGKEIPVSVTFFPVRGFGKAQSNHDDPVTHFAAIVTERKESQVPLWLQAQNWIPLVSAIVFTIGWLMGVEGAKELMIGTIGVRTVIGAVGAADKKTSG